ncbi:MAG: hypothetical protein ACLQF4_08495 [Xanthobacteraceae bacterium]
MQRSYSSRPKGASTIPSPHIPDPRSRGAAEVSQHNIHCGTIVRHDGSYFAFDHRQKLLGEYATNAEALKAFREINFDEVMS